MFTADRGIGHDKRSWVYLRPVIVRAGLKRCGFWSTSEGNSLTVVQQFQKLRLVVETAREIWRD